MNPLETQFVYSYTVQTPYDTALKDYVLYELTVLILEAASWGPDTEKQFDAVQLFLIFN